MTTPRRTRRFIVPATLAALLVGACLVSLLVGAVHVPVDELWRSGIVRLRLARTVLAATVGAALSVAGLIFQALLRNPLAEPYVLGVSSGAGLGAALAIVFGLGALGAWVVPGVAFAGALLTIVMVYALARTPSGRTPIETLLLSGVVVNAVLASMLMFLVAMTPAEELRNVVWWLLGSLQAFDWRQVAPMAALTAVGVGATQLFARDLNLMSLGEEPAAHLGLSVPRTRRLFFLVASLMAGATVASCGMVGFVGLIVPHAARRLVGPDHRRLVWSSALGGAAFLVLADVAARTALAPREISIGVVTALLGGPFFLFLLRRRTTAPWA